jgi:hypothetical protein
LIGAQAIAIATAPRVPRVLRHVSAPVWDSALVCLPFSSFFLLFRPFPTIGRTTNNAATTLRDAPPAPPPHYLFLYHPTLGDVGRRETKERRHLHGLSPLFFSLHPTFPRCTRCSYSTGERPFETPLQSRQRANRGLLAITGYTRAALRSFPVELCFSGLPPPQTRFGYLYKHTNPMKHTLPTLSSMA